MLRRIVPFILLLFVLGFSPAGEPLPGTQPLTAEGDLSAKMVEGIDRWLMREIECAANAHPEKWKPDASSVEAWEKSLAPRRESLRNRIGAVDERRSGALEIVRNAGVPVVKAEANGCTVERVRWQVFDGVHGEGILWRPNGPAKAAVIALPDADNTPEQFAGIAPGLPPEMQFARRFAEQGAVVIVMTLVDRRDEWSGSEKLKRYTNAPHREWIHRQSFESGRTLTGFEVQKVLAAVDALRGPSAKLLAEGAKIGVAGHGEGGLLALFSAALDPRIAGALVSGYLPDDKNLWKEPLYRNLQGSLRDVDAASLWMLTAPRTVFHDSRPPLVPGPPPLRDGRRGAAPGEIGYLDAEKLRKELRERQSLLPKIPGSGQEPKPAVDIGKDSVPSRAASPIGGQDTIAVPGALETPVDKFMATLGVTTRTVEPLKLPAVEVEADFPDARQRRTIRELEEFSQTVLRDAERTRKALPLWTKLKPGVEWEVVQRQARADFWENVIGKLPTDYAPPNPRTRLIHDKEKWRGYEVMLDVHPDIFAWGVLLVPKDLKPGERRPVVVCQHGLEGLPEDTITQDKSERAWNYYKGFAAKLCERGFIVYAPHNPYRGQDKFRWLQRKANPLGLSLFSFIIAQHDVTTQWLASLPFVDPGRIAFYGLSYGGKTAMRVPAVLERYCLSICSGDFNEWVLKCASNSHPNGYIFTGEWEIWEWDLAHTVNYAEMALLIAPRPFMVERGHDDGVGLDEHVGYEFAKVKRGYDKLGIGERAEIEWFDGPHTINGVETFKFLHKWLHWPEPK